MAVTAGGKGTDGDPFPPVAAIRHWLTLLHEPDRMVDTDLVELLKRTGRLPSSPTRVAVGRNGAELLKQVIDGLAPNSTAPRSDYTAYQVLRACFLDGLKARAASAKVGISVRQLSRERARAYGLVQAELVAILQEVDPPDEHADASPTPPIYKFESIPAIVDFVSRPTLTRLLAECVRASRIVHVHGPAGIGKTSMVAEHAVDASAAITVLWYRIRPGVNDTLQALLFEIGQHLMGQGRPQLSQLVTASLPRIDVSIVGRVAVSELSEHPGWLMVIDDFHYADRDPAISGFLDELTSRLSNVHLITVGRHRDPRPPNSRAVEVGALTPSETHLLLGKLGVRDDPELAEVVHQWTGGIAQLVSFAAPWLSTADPDEMTGGLVTLTTRDDVQAFLLDWLTGLLDSYDRDILEAASVFRAQFTDAALAFVSDRTKSQVGDASRRLVRYNVALRSRSGDVAFVHTSVRDYVYERLSAERLVELHQRIAAWYKAQGNLSEAAHHSGQAKEIRRARAGRTSSRAP
jgi:ATP/maltotriose-dependent transcriptional regulator MalT